MQPPYFGQMITFILKKGFIDKNKKDLLIFENIMLPESRAIEKWKKLLRNGF
jgi:hypothetical protein